MNLHGAHMNRGLHYSTFFSSPQDKLLLARFCSFTAIASLSLVGNTQLEAFIRCHPGWRQDIFAIGRAGHIAHFTGVTGEAIKLMACLHIPQAKGRLGPLVKTDLSYGEKAASKTVPV